MKIIIFCLDCFPDQYTKPETNLFIVNVIKRASDRMAVGGSDTSLNICNGEGSKTN